MRNAGGYSCITDPDLGTIESDTFTCKHCNRVVMVKPKTSPTDAGGMCGMCAGLICPACVADGRCLPFEERLARMEARDVARRSYG